MTVTLNRAVVVFPLESVAEQLAIVLPMWKRVPDLGVHDRQSPAAENSMRLALGDSEYIGMRMQAERVRCE